ncbi:MAG: glycosyltransferase family 2 protein [Terracidiphilus sp.]|jgi:GT2 family glycosyltransferase
MNNQTDLSIVIVSWNAKRYLAECLESLAVYGSAWVREVIVVDNASTDGTCEMVVSRFPDVKLLRNESNLGFAKANNIGIAQCSGEYVCLVNSDVKLIHDCFTPMLNYMRNRPDVALLGPKMLGADLGVGRSTMRFPTVWNSICRALGLDRVFKGSKLFGGQMVSDFDHEQTRDVEVLNGWFLMVRRSVLGRVGLLDERFFMYGEDIDWCYRFHQAGQRTVFFAAAEAIHYGGASSANAPVRFQIEMYRANCQYWKKHRGQTAALLYLLIIWLHQAVRLLGYLMLLPRRTSRSEAVFKMKKSLACMAWVIGISSFQRGASSVSRVG